MELDADAVRIGQEELLRRRARYALVALGLAALVAITLAYIAATEFAKRWQSKDLTVPRRPT